MQIDENKRKIIRHYVTYLIFGGLSTLISIGLFWILRQVMPMLNENIANMISILSAIVFAYFTNRKYVFDSENKNKKVEFLEFLISRGIAFVFESGTFWMMLNGFSTSEIVAKVTGCRCCNGFKLYFEQVYGI